MFQKRKEDFVCGHCGQTVKGNGYTNHCPVCLWSQHVDTAPGDRLETCRGMMKPVRIEKDKENFMIVHHCEICGIEKRNRVGKDDDFSVVLAIAQKYALDVSKTGKQL